MTMAISKAAEEGAQAVICASTGNTSASAAAYAVRAGMLCAVLVPEGKIALGQAVAGAGPRRAAAAGRGQLRRLPDPRPRPVRAATRSRWSTRVNPFRIEGQKTAAFEIVDALGDAPDIHVLPVGNAGNITAYWKGYREYAADGAGDARARGCGASRPPAPRRSSTARRSREP